MSDEAPGAPVLEETTRRKVLGLVGLGARGRLVVIGAEQVAEAPTSDLGGLLILLQESGGEGTLTTPAQGNETSSMCVERVPRQARRLLAGPGESGAWSLLWVFFFHSPHSVHSV